MPHCEEANFPFTFLVINWDLSLITASSRGVLGFDEYRPAYGPVCCSGSCCEPECSCKQRYLCHSLLEEMGLLKFLTLLQIKLDSLGDQKPCQSISGLKPSLAQLFHLYLLNGWLTNISSVEQQRAEWWGESTMDTIITLQTD